MTSLVSDQHFAILGDQLEADLGSASRANRAADNLDALALYWSSGAEIPADLVAGSETRGEIAALVLTGDRIQDYSIVARILDKRAPTPEMWNGIRLGLRLSQPAAWRQLLSELLFGEDAWGVAIAMDVLLFHRQLVDVDPVPLLQHDDPMIRRIVVGALGRSLDRNSTKGIAIALSDTDATVRREALRAAARFGLPELSERCVAMSTGQRPCLNAIRFLGVVGDHEDFGLLRQLAETDSTASAAVEAMGILGAAELIPDIVAAVSHPLTSHTAAAAIERISGRSLPRSAPPEPPAHLTEEELDFWFHPGEPVAEAAEEWWQQSATDFQSGKCYQAGRCVSDDPLGPGFNDLPDEVRRDLYLRQRARDYQNTPDWELETWPRHQRIPNWASQ